MSSMDLVFVAWLNLPIPEGCSSWSQNTVFSSSPLGLVTSLNTTKGKQSSDIEQKVCNCQKGKQKQKSSQL
jgi:hypothetical protein